MAPPRWIPGRVAWRVPDVGWPGVGSPGRADIALRGAYAARHHTIARGARQASAGAAQGQDGCQGSAYRSRARLTPQACHVRSIRPGAARRGRSGRPGRPGGHGDELPALAVPAFGRVLIVALALVTIVWWGKVIL